MDVESMCAYWADLQLYFLLELDMIEYELLDSIPCNSWSVDSITSNTIIYI